jgi:hypothetical protein
MANETKKISSELVKSLIKLQSELIPVIKNQEGHHGKFADLQQVMNTVRPILKDNGFALVQTPIQTSSGVGLKSILIHDSGESIEGDICIPVQRQNDPQAYGAALSYGRRYGIMTILGIVTEDDDAKSATITLEDKLEEIFKTNDLDELQEIWLLKFRNINPRSVEGKALIAAKDFHKAKLDNIAKMEKQEMTNAK